MKKKKWTIFHFSAGDFKAVEGYLNRQAAKGWELERAGLLLGRWRRTERGGLTWCVDLAKPRQEREEQEEYLALCREGGWELAAVSSSMYLFKSLPGRDPAPVQTDRELERRNYNWYYVREIILSLIVVAAFLAFYALLLRGAATDWARTFPAMRYFWMESWTLAALWVGLPVLGVCLLWRLLAFCAALIRGRDGRIPVSSRTVMWLNCVAGALILAAGVLVGVGAVLDTALTEKSNTPLLIMLGGYGAAALYRALTVDRELFPRERGRYGKAGAALLILLAVTAAAGRLLPFGQWDSYQSIYEGNHEAVMARYAQTESVPLVRTEDLGLPLTEEENSSDSFFKLTHSVTPMGERWEVENHYWGSGVWLTGCETYLTPTAGQAEWLARNRAEEMTYSAVPSSYDRFPADMAPVELDWADEAWYGQWQGEGRMISVLVLRRGNLAARLSAPVPLMTEELLPVIRGRLGL